MKINKKIGLIISKKQALWLLDVMRHARINESQWEKNTRKKLFKLLKEI